jgi:hypothetical protein
MVFQVGSFFCLEPPLYCNLPTSSYHTVGITGVNHHI